MEIKALAQGFIGANCYLLSDGGHAFVVDPCCRTEVILAALREQGLTLDGVLLTHGHFDHVMSLAPLVLACPAEICLGEGDADFPSDGSKNGFSVFYGQDRTFPPADRLLKDGDVLPLGNASVRVIATPGHTNGSVSFLCERSGEQSFLLTGDTLFSDNVGRTDLYGGSWSLLCRSLATLSELSRTDEGIVIYPGHGESALLSDALRAVL